MVDFINEVEEELRKDQYNALLRKWGPALVGLCVLVVAAAGAFEYFKSSDERIAKSTSISYIEATKLLEEGQTADATGLFLAIAGKARPGYAGLSLMQAAGIASDNGNSGQAVRLLDQAGKAFETDLHKDLVDLKAAYLLMDTGDYAAVTSRVTLLAQSGKPFEYLGRELLGFVALEQGDTQAANAQFSYLARSPDVPESLKARAEQVLALTPSSAVTPAEAVTDPESVLAPQPDAPDTETPQMPETVQKDSP